MLPDMDVMNCQHLAVPIAVMQHVVDVESSGNPYAIGVVGGRLVRQPLSLPEAVATARMLERRGYNFSLGLAQVNRHNLAKYGLATYETAFQACPNLQAGARILADCHARSGNDWGKAFSCYYSGNFVTGFRDGYVRKVFASMRAADGPIPAPTSADEIDVIGSPVRSHSTSPTNRNALASPLPAAQIAADERPVRVTAYARPTGQPPLTDGEKGAVLPITPDEAFVF